jgi:hypothetical protein
MIKKFTDGQGLGGSEVALNIFGDKTITPSPCPLPEGRGIYKDKGHKGKNNERPNT